MKKIVNITFRDAGKVTKYLCEDLDLSKEEIISKLETIGYAYDKELREALRQAAI